MSTRTAGSSAPPLRSVPRWGRWTLACAAGETVGMVAAASAAAASVVLVGEPYDVRSALVAVGLPVIGGAVEGFAVGTLQHRVLATWLPRLSRRSWVGTTTAVAAALWLLGMLPSTLVSWSGGAPTGEADNPSAWLMVLVGVGSGLVAGALFGAAQARVLRGRVARPWVWVPANAVGWAAAMAVIFTGASLPDERWGWPALLALGGLTGILAGVAIGGLTGLFLPALDRLPSSREPRARRWQAGRHEFCTGDRRDRGPGSGVRRAAGPRRLRPRPRGA